MSQLKALQLLNSGIQYIVGFSMCITILALYELS
jgi:hypothetical protein